MLQDQTFRIFASVGQGAIEKWDEYLSTAVDFMGSHRFLKVTISVIMSGRKNRVSNPASIARGGRGRRSRTRRVNMHRTPGRSRMNISRGTRRGSPRGERGVNNANRESSR